MLLFFFLLLHKKAEQIGFRKTEVFSVTLLVKPKTFSKLNGAFPEKVGSILRSGLWEQQLADGQTAAQQHRRTHDQLPVTRGQL